MSSTPPDTALDVNTQLTLTCTTTGFNNYPDITIKQSTQCPTEIIVSKDNTHTLEIHHALQNCQNGESFTCEVVGDALNRQSSTGIYNVICKWIMVAPCRLYNSVNVVLIKPIIVLFFAFYQYFVIFYKHFVTFY